MHRFLIILALLGASLAGGSQTWRRSLAADEQVQPTGARGSAPARPLITTQYTTAQGLPHNTVYCVRHSADGLVWLGTWHGLCSFDGTRFITYQRYNCVPTSVTPPSKIFQIEEDRNGYLWIRTADNRLCVFDKRHNAFIDVNDDLMPLSASLKVIKLQGQPDGTVLLLTSEKNLYEAYTGRDGRQHITLVYNARRDIDPTTRMLRHDVSGTSRLYHYYIGRDYTIRATRRGQQPAPAWTIKPGTLTYAGKNYDIPWDGTAGAQPELRAAAGVILLKQPDLHTVCITPAATITDLPSAEGIDIAPDGMLWLATVSNGVYTVSFPPQPFRFMPQLAGKPVRAMFQSPNGGDIWISLRDGTLYRFAPDLTLRRAMGTDFGHVYHIMQDRRGRLWFSTKGEGLLMLDPATGTERRFMPDPADRYAINSAKVYSTFQDRAGTIWVATFDGGVNAIVEKAGTVRFLNKGNAFSHYPRYGLYTNVRTITQHPDGTLFAATTDGLLAWDARHIFTTYRTTASPDYAVSDITALYRNHAGTIFVSVFGGRLRSITGTRPLTFKYYDTADPAGNNVYNAIAEDQAHNLWVLTENGLLSLAPGAANLRQYDRYQGLPQIDTETGALLAVAGSDQTTPILIGSKQGALVFQPQQLLALRIPDYNVAINDVVVNNQRGRDIQPAVANVVPRYADTLTFRHTQASFAIEYGAPNFRGAGQVEYRYQLEGYERQWHHVGDAAVATYTHVPHGEYTFHVVAIDRATGRHGHTRSVTVIVLPPWWLTTWAKLLYVLLAAAIAYLAWRITRRFLRMQSEIYVNERIAQLTAHYGAEPQQQTPAEGKSRPTALIVAKEELDTALIEKLAVRATLLTAETLDDAWRKITRQHPDIIIVTLALAGDADGFALIKLVRKDQSTNHVPIIAIGTSTQAAVQAEERTRATRLGAGAYVPLPIDTDYLLAAGTRLIAAQRAVLRRLYLQTQEQGTDPVDVYKRHTSKRDVELITAIKRKVEANMTIGDLNIDDLAAAVGLSRSALFKRVKTITGLAPVDYLREIRLAKAAWWLETTDDSIAEVAYRVGFHDSGYFGKCFRKKYGMTPKEYRAQHR